MLALVLVWAKAVFTLSRGFCCLLTGLLAGCSVHPIPDDVSPIPTEEIVRSARCEIRVGVYDEIEKRLAKHRITGWSRSNLKTPADWDAFSKFLVAHIKRNPDDAELMSDLRSYAEVAIAYDFDFNITEHGNVDSSLAFKLPLIDRTVDATAGGFLHTTRAGQRTFKAQETFAQLVLRDRGLCGDDFRVRHKNLLYPITGSIGLRRAVRTFIEISEQGGGKDSFVDTLTFTTAISAGVGGTIKINPVPNSFRLVNGSLSVGVDRTDVHKVTISLAFPQEKKDKIGRTREEQEKIGLAAPFEMNTIWRARYNICVADARNREDSFKLLRLSAPEVYCITHADAFVPRYTDKRMPQLMPPPNSLR
jgi:hypothetical protein